MVRGVVYSTAGTRRAVVALDAATGELMWMHSEREGERGAEAPRQLSGRGLSYWTDGREERILYVTPGYRLIALDAKTGIPVSSFGKNGVVDLKMENDQVIDPVKGEIGLHATPIVAGNTVIIGAAHMSGGVPRGKSQRQGLHSRVRRQDGKRLWIFHTIPQSGEFGNNTWEKDSGCTPATQVCGLRSRSMKSWGWRICRSSSRRATTMAGIGLATTCSARASSRSI